MTKESTDKQIISRKLFIFVLIGFLVRVAFFQISWFIYNSDIQRNYTSFVFLTDFVNINSDWIVYAKWMNSGAIPYVDFNFEYPPLGALVIYFPSLLGSFDKYIIYFAYTMILFEIGNIILIYILSSSYMSQKSRDTLMWIYISFPPLLYFSFTRIDAVITFTVLLSLYFTYINENPALAFFSLALGVLTKFLPLFLLLPFLLVLIKNRKYNQALLAIVIFTGTIILAITPFFFFSSGCDGIWWMMRYHVVRNIDIGAVIFLFFSLPSKIFFGDLYTIPNLLSPAQIAIQLLTYLYFMWKIWNTSSKQIEQESVVDSYFWAIVLGTTVNPQFFMTIIAVCSISKNSKKGIIAAFLLTFHWVFLFIVFLFPSLYVPSGHTPTRK